MKHQTETLSVGSPAPPFTLLSANSGAKFSLSDLLSRGAAIIEFLRGTW
jgi:peroxiredoxin